MDINKYSSYIKKNLVSFYTYVYCKYKIMKAHYNHNLKLSSKQEKKLFYFVLLIIKVTIRINTEKEKKKDCVWFLLLKFKSTHTYP